MFVYERVSMSISYDIDDFWKGISLWDCPTISPKALTRIGKPQSPHRNDSCRPWISEPWLLFHLGGSWRVLQHSFWKYWCCFNCYPCSTVLYIYTCINSIQLMFIDPGSIWIARCTRSLLESNSTTAAPRRFLHQEHRAFLRSPNRWCNGCPLCPLHDQWK